MHRFPTSTDFTPLVGLAVIQDGIGQNELILYFHPIGRLRLEGAWALKDTQGGLLDHSMHHPDRDAWRIHKLIGVKTGKCVLRDDRHLDICFDGAVLEIVDDSDQYETFAIELPSLKLYV